MSMSMESMECEWELEGGVVGVVVDVGVGDLAEVVPVTRAGLLAPAAQAQPTQLATGACAEGGSLGAVEPLAVAVLFFLYLRSRSVGRPLPHASAIRLGPHVGVAAGKARMATPP